MSVIAHDPEVHVVPVAGLFGVLPHFCGEIIHDACGFQHEIRLMARGMRGLVDPREGDEGDIRSVAVDSSCGLTGDITVDGEPAADVAPEVGYSGAGRKGK